MNPNQQLSQPAFPPTAPTPVYAKQPRLTRKHILRIIAIIVGLIILLFAYNMRNSGWIVLAAPASLPEKTTAKIEIKRENYKTVQVQLQPGERKRIRLDAGRVEVAAAAGSARAVDIIDIKRFSTRTLTTPVSEERAVKQIASNTYTCPLLVAGVAYSYACGSPSTITRHTPTSSGISTNTVLFDSQEFQYMQPYMNGVIAMPGGVGAKLSYIDLAAETIQPITLTQTITDQLAEEQPQIVTHNDATNTRFGLLLPFANKFYVFDNSTDTTPTTIKPGAAVNFNEGGRSVTASFTQDSIVLYVGVATREIDEEADIVGGDAAPIPLNAPSYIFEYELSGTLKNRIPLSKEFIAEDVYKLTGDYYIAQRTETITFYYRNNNVLQEIYSLQDVGSWAVYKDKAYLEAYLGAYIFVPGSNGTFSLHGVYASSSTLVSVIHASPGGPLFTGYVTNEGRQTLNIYTLGDQKLAAGQPQQIEPAYEGFEAMLEQGLTNDHIDNIKYAIAQYTNTTSTVVTKVGVADLQVVSRSRENPDAYLTFTLSLNGSSTGITVRATYDDFDTVRAVFTDKSGAKLYDSGTLNSQTNRR